MVARPATLWPTTYCDVKVERASELHRIAEVGDTATAGDRGRVLVDQAVVHPAAFVVSRVGGLQQLSRERLGNLADGLSK